MYYTISLRSLSFVILLCGLLSCAAIDPQTKENIDSTPKVREEDITENRSNGPTNQFPQNLSSPSPYGPGQPGNTISPTSPESGGGKNPRRFLWKDRN